MKTGQKISFTAAIFLCKIILVFSMICKFVSVYSKCHVSLAYMFMSLTGRCLVYCKKSDHRFSREITKNTDGSNPLKPIFFLKLLHSF